MGILEEAGLKILFEENYNYKGYSFEIVACLHNNKFATIIISDNKKPMHYINLDGFAVSNKVMLEIAKMCIRDLMDD